MLVFSGARGAIYDPARHRHAAVPVSGGMLVWAGSGGTFERPRRFSDGAILRG